MATAQQSPHTFTPYRRDAFSHSEQCDSYAALDAGNARGFCDLQNNTALDIIQVDTFTPGWYCHFKPIRQLVGLFKHKNCRCWCHQAVQLYTSSEPEYDLTPPPEYLSSADRAFTLDEPVYVRVGFSEIDAVAEPLELGDSEVDGVEAGEFLRVVDASTPEGIDGVRTSIPSNKAGFANWSAVELKTGKCELCGDKLADCECVE